MKKNNREDLTLAALEASDDGILILSADGSPCHANGALARLCGVNPRTLAGRPAREWMAAWPDLDLEDLIGQAMTGGRPVCREVSTRTGTDVDERVLVVTVTPFQAPDGERTGAVVNVREVTDARQLLVRMSESEVRFRTMADSAPVLLWMAGRDGLCTYFNATWLRFTGRTMEQEVGSGWAEGVHAQDLALALDTYMEAFVARKEFRMEYRMRRADGQYRWVLDTGVPRFGSDHSFAGFIGSCIDVTEIHEAHDELMRINDNLEAKVEERTAQLVRSNADLEQFASIASHDLQEPLRKITSFASLLTRSLPELGDSTSREYLDSITRAAQRLQRQVHDLLSYARLSGEVEPPTSVDLGDALDRALDNLESVIGDTGAVVGRGPLPRVEACGSQLTLLFQNLVHNAIKFRGEAPPRVHVEAERQRGEWHVTVADNGIGFDLEKPERLFQIFSRLKTAPNQPGNGIGLALCRRVVERHGGRIWAESRPGRGSVFHFSLAATPQATEAVQ